MAYFSGINKLTSYYIFQAHYNTTQTGISSNTNTVMNLNTIDYNPSAMTFSNNVLTIPFSGYYNILAQTSYATSGAFTSQTIFILIQVGASPAPSTDTVIARTDNGTSNVVCVTCTMQQYLSANTIIYAAVRSNVSTTFTVGDASRLFYQSMLKIYFIGE